MQFIDSSPASISLSSTKNFNPHSIGSQGAEPQTKFNFSLPDVVHLLESDNVKNKTDSLLWHETMTNTITKHKPNHNMAEKVQDLIKTLFKHTWRSKAFICCHREGTTDTFDQIRLLNTLNVPAGKKLVTTSKYSSGGIGETWEEFILLWSSNTNTFQLSSND